MQTSALGLAFIEHHEGVVLKAYRDTVGVWTIGAGLTAASGVVSPKAGMQISREEATRLMLLALDRNYEPAVELSMLRAQQHEFDAGVSFHWNCGAIRTATWVRYWREKRAAFDIRAKLALWNKGQGKVLPGLVRRRTEEADILLEARYPAVIVAATLTSGAPAASEIAPAGPILARWMLPLSTTEKSAAIKAFRTLGYDAGPYLDVVSDAAVKAFQKDHGLTIDGKIGRATLSTLQRMIDARKKVVAPLAATVVAAPVAASGIADALSGVPYGAEAALGLAALRGLWIAFQYRDALAAEIQPALPRVAAFLRSF